MDEDLRAELLESLERSYEDFLKSENVLDNPMYRISFYAAALLAVENEPDEDPKFQEFVKEYLKDKIQEHSRALAESFGLGD